MGVVECVADLWVGAGVVDLPRNARVDQVLETGPEVVGVVERVADLWVGAGVVGAVSVLVLLSRLVVQLLQMAVHLTTQTLKYGGYMNGIIITVLYI